MKTLADFGIHLPQGSSGNVAILCPRCSHTRKKHKHDKCLSVNPDKGVWNCHHCGWAGSTSEKYPFGEARKEFKRPSYIETAGLSADGLAWLKKRGISEQIAADAKLTSKGEFIRFPFIDEYGEVVNVKSRSCKTKKFFMEAGAERILYGMDKLSNKFKYLIWTEGEIDALSFREAGYPSVVSVPDGAPQPKSKDYASKFSFLEAAEEVVNGFDMHVIATDSDEAGKKLADELARRLGPEKCRLVEWPEGTKDANDLLCKSGKEAIKEALVRSRDYPIKGIHTINDISGHIRKLFAEGDIPGLYAGWDSLRRYYTVRPGELTVLTGIPNHGKSEWLDALMVNLAQLHGWTFGVCSPENRPLQRHFAKLASKYTEKPFSSGPSDRMTEEELNEAIEWGEKHFVFVLPTDEDMCVENVIKLAKVLVYRRGINGLVIDPWGDLVQLRDPGMNETQYIAQSLTMLRQFARDHNVHVWVVAHPKQLEKSVSGPLAGSYPVPTPYDISGSAHWRNKPDNCLCVYREDPTEGNSVEIHVQKVRFKQVGRPGIATLLYNRVNGKYHDPPATPTPF